MRRCSGVTLAEVLITTGIMLLVFGMMVQVAGLGSRNLTMMPAELQLRNDAISLSKAFGEELGSAYRLYGRNPQATTLQNSDTSWVNVIRPNSAGHLYDVFYKWDSSSSVFYRYGAPDQKPVPCLRKVKAFSILSNPDVPNRIYFSFDVKGRRTYSAVGTAAVVDMTDMENTGDYIKPYLRYKEGPYNFTLSPWVIFARNPATLTYGEIASLKTGGCYDKIIQWFDSGDIDPDKLPSGCNFPGNYGLTPGEHSFSVGGAVVTLYVYPWGHSWPFESSIKRIKVTLSGLEVVMKQRTDPTKTAVVSAAGELTKGLKDPTTISTGETVSGLGFVVERPLDNLIKIITSDDRTIYLKDDTVPDGAFYGSYGYLMGELSFLATGANFLEVFNKRHIAYPIGKITVSDPDYSTRFYMGPLYTSEPWLSPNITVDPSLDPTKDPTHYVLVGVRISDTPPSCGYKYGYEKGYVYNLSLSDECSRIIPMAYTNDVGGKEFLVPLYDNDGDPKTIPAESPSPPAPWLIRSDPANPSNSYVFIAPPSYSATAQEIPCGTVPVKRETWTVKFLVTSSGSPVGKIYAGSSGIYQFSITDFQDPSKPGANLAGSQAGATLILDGLKGYVYLGTTQFLNLGAKP
ncbi:MAG: hypothetical protein HYU64_01195 [Armatimonadetes bacterium]|nr:hypothetical protein [Armatimonadota bacterium]